MLPMQKRYAKLLGSQLKRFRAIKADMFNFRCPYCGDSDKNEHKARGYLFLSPDQTGLIYKCHNCGEPRSFTRFLKDQDETLYKQYLADVLRHRDGYERDRRIKQEKRGASLVSPKDRKTEQYLIDLGAKRISELPDDHEAVEYLLSRFVDRSEFDHLYHTNEFKKFIHSMQQDKFKCITRDTSAIIFPLLEEDGETMNGAQFRNLDQNDDLRYITIKISEANGRFFGFHRMQGPKEPKYIVEGAIDSLMLPPGSLAVSGSDLLTAHHYENVTYIFDNEPRNKEIVKKIEHAVAMGVKVCLLPEDYYKMDLNDIVRSGLATKEQLPNLIKSHTYSGLLASLKFSEWRKV